MRVELRFFKDTNKLWTARIVVIVFHSLCATL